MSNKAMPLLNKNFNLKLLLMVFLQEREVFQIKTTLVLIVILIQMIQF